MRGNKNLGTGIHARFGYKQAVLPVMEVKKQAVLDNNEATTMRHGVLVDINEHGVFDDSGADLVDLGCQAGIVNDEVV